MNMLNKRFPLGLLAAGFLAGACTGETPMANLADAAPVDAMVFVQLPDAPLTPFQEALDNRELDYSAALRIAALRLTGDLPTLQQVKEVAESDTPQAVYEQLINTYLLDARFADVQVDFWKNTFKMGGSGVLNSAGVFAAQLVVENRSYLELLTATSGTCPTYNPNNKTFTAADCSNGVSVHAGLLSHPGVNAHFFSNMAFRRTRWVQETFACAAFPAEADAEPIKLSDTATYTAPWEFESIAGTASGGEIDFLDISSVVCANCHATMNHLAPLFGNFDEMGVLQGTISVPKPVTDTPMTVYADWLPEGQQPGWRFGKPVADLPGLGQAMADDPRIAECAVARAWNWAMGKGDIVDTRSAVPAEVFESQQAAFVASNYDFKTLLYLVFTSDDFTRF